MATRFKTVEYVFDSITAATVSSTRYNFAQTFITMPEINSRTFTSVYTELTFRDSATASNTNMTGWLASAVLNGVSAADKNTSITMNNSRNRFWYFPNDWTALFNNSILTSTTGATWIFVFALSGSAVSANNIANNISCKTIITYQYNDSGQDQFIKTVRIPIESLSGVPANTMVQIGNNQVPALDTFLPEGGKLYRDIWFELMYIDNNSAGNNEKIVMALDSENPHVTDNYINILNNRTNISYIWKRWNSISATNISTSATHQFNISATVSNSMCNPGAIMGVTYEYSLSSSTAVMNSLVFPLSNDLTSQLIGGTISSQYSRAIRSFYICDPLTTTLQQSGILWKWNYNGVANIYTRIGNQNWWPMSPGVGGTIYGYATSIMRFDSSATGGSGLTLVRGINNLTADLYSAGAGNSTLLQTGVNGLIFLNYISGISGGTDQTNTHTVLVNTLTGTVSGNAGTPSITAVPISASVLALIPETDIYLVDNSYRFPIINSSFDAFTYQRLLPFVFSVSANGEYNHNWLPINSIFTYYAGYQYDNYYFTLTPYFKNNFKDTFTQKLTLTSFRAYKFDVGAANGFTIVSLPQLVTYHSHLYPISGIVSSYTGDGSNIIVYVHTTYDNSNIMQLTTAVGGSWSGNWYDNSVNLYAHTRQDSTHTGRSDNGLAFGTG